MLGEGPWVGLLVVTEVPLSLLCHLLKAQPAGREEGLGCACLTFMGTVSEQVCWISCPVLIPDPSSGSLRAPLGTSCPDEVSVTPGSRLGAGRWRMGPHPDVTTKLQRREFGHCSGSAVREDL